MDRDILCTWIGWYRLLEQDPHRRIKDHIYSQMVHYGIRRDFAYDAVYNGIPIL
jgi:hypothetical protein